jgi:hypothetical protein
MDLVSVLLFAGGLLVVGSVLFDAFCTTVSVSGGGPLTTRLARNVWQGALRWHWRRERGGSGGRHGLLAWTGPTILIGIVITWIVLLGVGVMMLFSAESSSVVNATTKAPADFWERLYFTGFTISTLGIGDFVPQGPLWRVVTGLAALSGLFVVTLSITYLMPVLSAVVEKRRLAASIAGLGETPRAILRGGWDGESLDSLEQPLVSISAEIEMHTQRHLVYPVVHFFHSTEKRTAIGPRVAALSEALRLIERMPTEAQPPPASTRVARSAVDGMLSTLRSAFLRTGDDEPPVPSDAQTLREVGLPTREATPPHERDAKKAERRRRLLRVLVEDDGWHWRDVTED